jgi:hypothetical protein
MSLSQQTHWQNISGPQTRTSRSNSQKGHWFGTTIYSFKNGTQIRGRSGTQAKATQICSSMIMSILLHKFLHNVKFISSLPYHTFCFPQRRTHSAEVQIGRVQHNAMQGQQELKLTIHGQPWKKFRNWERGRLSNDVTGIVSWFHDVIWTMDCY